ncbi:MAG: hypothetical protein JST24_07950 [Acidobacteria bacterium]|nr:hypothetical protein [Acidobacteriota bacterium]
MLEASNRVHLDRPVQVLEDIPSYIFSAGWGDGLGVLPAGSLIYLRYQEQHRIYYYAGPREPTPHSVESCHGGFFDELDLAKVRDLDPREIEMPRPPPA